MGLQCDSTSAGVSCVGEILSDVASVPQWDPIRAELFLRMRLRTCSPFASGGRALHGLVPEMGVVAGMSVVAGTGGKYTTLSVL